MSQSVLELIANNYLSFVLLIGIALIVLLNKRTDIPAVNTIWIILGLVLCVLCLNVVSDWAEQDVSRTAANYWAATIKYVLNPFIICFEIYALTEKKLMKRLILIPAAVNAFITTILPLISSVTIIWYDENNRFHATPWRLLPYAVSVFYLILWVIQTYQFFRRYKDPHCIAALFIVLITLLTMLLEYNTIVTGLIDEITLIDIYLYYYYLTTVYQYRVKDQMQQKDIELSRVKLKLLREQISPHFVYNALAIIKSLVWEDAQKASDTIDDFSTYLRQNVNTLQHTEDMIPFTAELEHIKALQRIDEAGKGKRTDVVYDIREDNFRVPPLSIEPLFENALLHGISDRKDDGEIRIFSAKADGGYIVKVIDNGTGFYTAAETDGVGLENIRARLKYICNGTLTIKSDQNGTTATVCIPDAAKGGNA